jgi:hypothetical protein
MSDLLNTAESTQFFLVVLIACVDHAIADAYKRFSTLRPSANRERRAVNDSHVDQSLVRRAESIREHLQSLAYRWLQAWHAMLPTVSHAR